MNLKSLILLGTLMSGVLAARAQDNDMGLEPNQAVIGHTITNQIDISDAFFGEPGKYTLGARLTADDLRPYAGCKVIGVRFAIGVAQPRTRVFINRVVGTDLYDGASKNFNAQVGWNNVIFAEPITIAEGDSYFYGFDYSETAEMAEAESGGICCVGGSNSNGAMIMMNNALYPLSGVGHLCVQLIVDVTNLTAHDMNIGFFDTGFKYKSIDTQFEVFADIPNNGRDAISKFRLGCQFDDAEPQYFNVSETVKPGNSYTFNRKVKYPEGIGIGAHKFCLFIDSIEEGAAPERGIKEKSFNFALYSKSVERKQVYVEMYADPSTPYTALTNDIFNTLPDPDKTAIFVNVYPAGSALECNISAELHDRYAYTTPCFSTNRSWFPGEPAVAYSDFNQYFGMFDTQLFHSITRDLIDNDLYSPSFADLKLSGSYDSETRTATIRATITPLADEVPAIFGNLALNLLVVENGVKASQMVVNNFGTVVESKNYSNPNVLRHACFGADGVKVDSPAETSTIEQQIQLPADWNARNVRIVGVLTPWHEEGELVGLRDLDIVNCSEIRVADLPASIAEISAAGDSPAEYFTISGQRTNASRPGIYLKRSAAGYSKVLKK